VELPLDHALQRRSLAQMRSAGHRYPSRRLKPLERSSAARFHGCYRLPWAPGRPVDLASGAIPVYRPL
jgi:hypothetical protein